MALLLQSTAQAVQWLREHVAGTLSSDSRTIRPGDGFIAWPGAATDGRAHVPAAIALGAAACLVEHEGASSFEFGGARVASYQGLKKATGPIAAAWFDHPAQQMEVVAITGTNGKTSSAWWLAQALSKVKQTLHVKAAVVGTLGVGIPPHVLPTGLTTPDPVQLHAALRSMADAGVTACAIEASSIGLAEHRLAGLPVQVAVFTNFTQDHLDYHGSMEAYWKAKQALFAWPGLRAAVINCDDAQGAVLAATLNNSGVDIWTTSCLQQARLRASSISCGAQGLEFVVHEAELSYPLLTRLMGDYNVANLLGVLGAMRALGVSLADAVDACASLLAVPGRMDCVSLPGLPLVAVDYAHTPDALHKTLSALRPVAQQRSGQLWCVFGCGGARDAGKRPLMGAIAAKGADRVVVTSDNPRNEDAATIISHIVASIPDARRQTVKTEPDRAVAIAYAVSHAGNADVILVAGKGHENTQEIAGVHWPFSDLQHAQTALDHRACSGASDAARGYA